MKEPPSMIYSSIQDMLLNDHAAMRTSLGIKKTTLVGMWFRVELPGVEPGSKQATHKVSTCLVRCWFSYTGWHRTAYLYLIPF